MTPSPEFDRNFSLGAVSQGVRRCAIHGNDGLSRRKRHPREALSRNCGRLDDGHRRGLRENLESRYVFVTERGGPATTAGFLKTIARTGEAAKLPFPVHPHMLRHSTGYKLANDGHDTRALQHYMGHKNIMHTVRYTEMAPDRFKNFWKD